MTEAAGRSPSANPALCSRSSRGRVLPVVLDPDQPLLLGIRDHPEAITFVLVIDRRRQVRPVEQTHRYPVGPWQQRQARVMESCAAVALERSHRVPVHYGVGAVVVNPGIADEGGGQRGTTGGGLCQL